MKKKYFCEVCDKRTVQSREVGERVGDIKPVTYTCSECDRVDETHMDYGCLSNVFSIKEKK